MAEKAKVAASKLGRQVQIDPSYQTMLSEDVGVFLEQAPGCFILLGAGCNDDGSPYPHHHPRFNFDERAMSLAAALLLQTGLELAG